MSEPPRALRILREGEVMKRTTLSLREIKRQVREGTFPAPIMVGRRTPGWVESEIDEWIKAKMSQRSDGGGPTWVREKGRE